MIKILKHSYVSVAVFAFCVSVSWNAQAQEVEQTAMVSETAVQPEEGISSSGELDSSAINPQSFELVFGLVDSNPNRAQKIAQPLVDHIVRTLDLPDYKSAKLVILSDVNAAVDLLKNNQLHILFADLHSLIVVDPVGEYMQVIAEQVISGNSVDHAVFVTLANSTIKTLDDFKGHRLGVGQLNDTITHLLPRKELLDQRITMDYSGEDSKAVHMVYTKNSVEAEEQLLGGSLDGAVIEASRYYSLSASLIQKLKVITETEDIPVNFVGVSKKIQEESRRKIQKAFLDLLNDPEAKLLLARFNRTTHFENLPENYNELFVSFAQYCDFNLHANFTEQKIEHRSKQLIIGRVSDNPKKHIKRIKSMVEYVVSQLKDTDITEAKFIIYRNNDQLIKALQNKEVDWVSETPFSAIIFAEQGGADIVLRRWKREVSEYYTVLFVHKNSGIETFSDLKGKKIAFEDPGSTSSFFVPYALLKKEGLKLVELSNPRAEVPADSVGYVFSNGELNATTWVHKGIVDAAALHNLDWYEEDDHVPTNYKKDLKLIYESDAYPRQVELFRSDLDEQVKSRVIEILLNADKTPDGRRALDEYNNTSKFDLITPEIEKNLQFIRDLADYIKDEL